MKTLAYCAASFEKSVHRAAGVQPVLSPPVDLELISPAQFEGYDFIYFKLHGLPGQPYWYGDFWTTAISADQVRKMTLDNTIIFAACCHLYQGEPGHYRPGPMLTALLSAGARAIVGGPGINYAKGYALYGADVLGHAFRIFTGLKFQPTTALRLALARTRLHLRLKKKRITEKELADTIDTLAFRIFDNKPTEAI